MIGEHWRDWSKRRRWQVSTGLMGIAEGHNWSNAF